MPPKEDKAGGRSAAPAPKPKPEPCVHVLQRTQGWSLQQASDYAATLSDADQAKLGELAQLPHHGDAVRRLLGDVADRQLAETKKGKT